MAKSPSHPHRLKKHRYKTGNYVFFCTLPDCHYKIDVALSLGKRAECNICGREFLLNEYSLKLKYPHCEGCGKVKIKDSDGKTRYAKKITHEILTGIVTETSQDLRARLNSVASPDLEDDVI